MQVCADQKSALAKRPPLETIRLGAKADGTNCREKIAPPFFQVVEPWHVLRQVIFEHDLRARSSQSDQVSQTRLGHQMAVRHKNRAIMVSAQENLMIFTSRTFQEMIGEIIKGVTVFPKVHDCIGE